MTTTTPPQAAPSGSLTAADMAARAGLHPDLVSRFVPPAENTAAGPLYAPHQLAVAQHVKQLTDVGTPPAVIDQMIRYMPSREARNAGSAPNGKRRRGILAAGAGVVVLLIGGLLGGAITAASRQPAAAPNPEIITVPGPTQTEPVNAALPTTPDPVCAEWGSLTKSYLAQREDWLKTDPDVPASQWSLEQRELSMAVIPVMKAEARDMRRLGERAQNPVLRMTLHMEAGYQEAYANRLPQYVVEDQRLWVAANDFSDTANSLCHAMAPR